MPKFTSTSDLLAEVGWIKSLPDAGGQAGAGVLAVAGAAAGKADSILEMIQGLKKERAEAIRALKAEVKASKRRMATFYRPEVIAAAVAASAAPAPAPAPAPEAKPKAKK